MPPNPYEIRSKTSAAYAGKYPFRHACHAAGVAEVCLPQPTLLSAPIYQPKPNPGVGIIEIKSMAYSPVRLAWRDYPAADERELLCGQLACTVVQSERPKIDSFLPSSCCTITSFDGFFRE